jgi:hypothetical protein
VAQFPSDQMAQFPSGASIRLLGVLTGLWSPLWVWPRSRPRRNRRSPFTHSGSIRPMFQYCEQGPIQLRVDVQSNVVLSHRAAPPFVGAPHRMTPLVRREPYRGSRRGSPSSLIQLRALVAAILSRSIRGNCLRSRKSTTATPDSLNHDNSVLEDRSLIANRRRGGRIRVRARGRSAAVRHRRSHQPARPGGSGTASGSSPLRPPWLSTSARSSLPSAV